MCKFLKGFVFVIMISGCELVDSANDVVRRTCCSNTYMATNTVNNSTNEGCIQNGVLSVGVEATMGFPKLSNDVLRSYHPVKGERFYNSGDEKLEVFQICKEEGEDGREAKYVLARDDHGWSGLIFIVISSHDYVDEELVAKGLYEYIGTHTYETKNGMKKTVRLFKEVEE